MTLCLGHWSTCCLRVHFSRLILKKSPQVHGLARLPHSSPRFLPGGQGPRPRCPRSRSADTHSGRQLVFRGQCWVRGRSDPCLQPVTFPGLKTPPMHRVGPAPVRGACDCEGFGFVLRRPMGQERLKQLGQRLPVGQRESPPGWEPALDVPLIRVLLIFLFRKPGLR